MTITKRIASIKEKVVSHPDFPKPGIIFRDFLPVFQHPDLFEDVLSLFKEFLEREKISVECIVGLEARGFILGPALALKLKVPFVPLRKPGKLPGSVKKEVYSLEYGQDALEIQTDALHDGMKVVIVDDLIATGGSMQAAVKLIENCGGLVQCCLSAMELLDLNGRSSITSPVFSIIQY